MPYVTKNKKTVISFLKENNDQHLTIEQIAKGLPDIPQASLYRIIDSLVEVGVVRKYVIDNNAPACFQYIDDGISHNHFHLLCTRCGKLIHLECHEVEELISHIEKEHGFSIDVSKVNLYGLCDECKKESEQ